MTKHTKPIPSLAKLMQDKPSNLQHLLQKAQQYQKLSQAIQHLLPAPLGGQVSVLSYQSGILKLGIENQAAAAKLRFQLSDLMSYLRQQPQWHNLITIKPVITSSIDPNSKKDADAAQQPVALPEALEAILKSHIESTDDDAWRESLLRFLKHHY